MPFPVAIDTQELPLAIATLYTAPRSMRLTDILLSNRTSGALTATIHVVPRAGSASNANKILGAVTIDANDTQAFSAWNVILGQGYMIRAFASGAGLNFTGTVTDDKPPH